MTAPYRISRRPTGERRAEIVQQYRDGSQTTELSRVHGLSKSALLKVLADEGVHLRRRLLTSEQVEEGRRLYAAGWSLSQASFHMGVDQDTLRLALKGSRGGAPAGEWGNTAA